jgi:hypothetical protein
MCGCALIVSLAAMPARSIMRAKPAVVNAAPRSEVNTKGDLESTDHSLSGTGLALFFLGRTAEVKAGRILLHWPVSTARRLPSKNTARLGDEGKAVRRGGADGFAV